MSTPTVTELRARLEAVTHDTFIDDLSRTAAQQPTEEKPC